MKESEVEMEVNYVGDMTNHGGHSAVGGVGGGGLRGRGVDKRRRGFDGGRGRVGGGRGRGDY